jgi:hypothetical protein
MLLYISWNLCPTLLIEGCSSSVGRGVFCHRIQSQYTTQIGNTFVSNAFSPSASYARHHPHIFYFVLFIFNKVDCISGSCTGKEVLNLNGVNKGCESANEGIRCWEQGMWKY